MIRVSSVLKTFSVVCLLLSYPLQAAIFFNLDTTSLLQCTFSSKHQNRVMIENGRIEKVIGADEKQLSIHMEELSGQAFIRSLDPNIDEVSLSIVSQTGAVQDLQILFIERSSEVVVLHDLQHQEDENDEQDDKSKDCENSISLKVSDILTGNIPEGYIPCSIKTRQWSPKKGIVIESIAEMDGDQDVLCVYQISNVTRKKITLFESEMQGSGDRWIFMESNTLLPKQKILSIISVEKYAE